MTTVTQPARLSPFAVFRHRSFTRLWLAQFVSQLGSGLTTIAAALLIYRMTGSALSVGLTLIATSLPSLLVGLLAGAVVDRIGRRLIIQRQTPREMRGRVNSAFFVARDLFFLLGMAAAGLADLIDVRVLWTVGGLVLLATGLLAVMLPGLRQPASEWCHAVRLEVGAQAGPRGRNG
jgi:MFS family permease